MSDRDWDKAKEFLFGVVDALLKEKGSESSSGSTDLPSTSGSQSQRIQSSSNDSSCTPRPNVYDEHRRIFGYQPSKRTKNGKGKGSAKGGNARAKGKNKCQTWSKEVMCLRYCDQATSPNTEEKIQLVQLNLGFKKLIFNVDGDANHIHGIIMEAFPILDECGGYTLMRVAENSRDLVSIEGGPDGGICVLFLKEILRQAKLYVRPLQCDLPEDKLKSLNMQAKELNLGGEPEDYCRICDVYLPMSELRKHVAQGTCKKRKRRDLYSGIEEEDDHFEYKSKYSRPIIKEDDDRKSDNDEDDLAVIRVEKPESSLLSSNTGATHEARGSLTCSSFMDILDEPGDDDWEFDTPVQEAIHDSHLESSSSIAASKPQDVKEVLQKHRRDLLYTDEWKEFRITVRRSNIWDDAAKAMKRSFDDKEYISVVFLGESAVDDGGPKREFFTLALKSIQSNNSLLDGPASTRVLRHNTTALQENLYLCIGKIIALSLVHGGPGPSFFSKCVVEYLFNDISAVVASIDDIPDATVRQQFQMLQEADSDARFRELLLQCSDYLVECGITKPAVKMTLQDKERVISAVSLHYGVLASLAELDQLKRGLTTAKFCDLMQGYQELLKPLFRSSPQKVSSDFIQDFYNVIYSDSGSNKRVKEEALIMNWICYLQELEENSESPPSLNDVFMFLTGCSEVPPMGYGSDVYPRIYFSDALVFPKVSTCALTLTIPYSFPSNFEDFKEKMNFSILNSQGFGQV